MFHVRIEKSRDCVLRGPMAHAAKEDSHKGRRKWVVSTKAFVPLKRSGDWRPKRQGKCGHLLIKTGEWTMYKSKTKP